MYIYTRVHICTYSSVCVYTYENNADKAVNPGWEIRSGCTQYPKVTSRYFTASSLPKLSLLFDSIFPWDKCILLMNFMSATVFCQHSATKSITWNLKVLFFFNLLFWLCDYLGKHFLWLTFICAFRILTKLKTNFNVSTPHTTRVILIRPHVLVLTQKSRTRKADLSLSKHWD